MECGRTLFFLCVFLVWKESDTASFDLHKHTGVELHNSTELTYQDVEYPVVIDAGDYSTVFPGPQPYFVIYPKNPDGTVRSTEWMSIEEQWIGVVDKDRPELTVSEIYLQGQNYDVRLFDLEDVTILSFYSEPEAHVLRFDEYFPTRRWFGFYIFRKEMDLMYAGNQHSVTVGLPKFSFTLEDYPDPPPGFGEFKYRFAYNMSHFPSDFNGTKNDEGTVYHYYVDLPVSENNEVETRNSIPGWKNKHVPDSTLDKINSEARAQQKRATLIITNARLTLSCNLLAEADFKNNSFVTEVQPVDIGAIVALFAQDREFRFNFTFKPVDSAENFDREFGDFFYDPDLSIVLSGETISSEGDGGDGEDGLGSDGGGGNAAGIVAGVLVGFCCILAIFIMVAGAIILYIKRRSLFNSMRGKDGSDL